MAAAPTPSTRLKLFLALSRTPHGLLDLATPGAAALLVLGGFPSLGTIFLGVLTVFSGYTAVYALNDLVDYRVDRAKLAAAGAPAGGGYLDAVFVRHPLAQGLLTYSEGLLWAASWGLVALLGAYLLNPVCAYIFVLGCILESIYCRLLTVTHWRILVAGVVKTLGGIAAMFAVTPHPAPFFLTIFFLWIFCWEVGGQNIPADWHDLGADRAAMTIPVVHGVRSAGSVVFVTLAASVALSLAVVALSPLGLTAMRFVLLAAAGLYFLLLPAWRLSRDPAREAASALFNRASFYPLAVLLIILPGLVAD